MEKQKDGESEGRFEYKLLETKRTSTLEKEMEQETARGYSLADMGESSRKRKIAIMRKDKPSESNERFEYELLETKKLSTPKKEVQELAEEGYRFRSIFFRRQEVSSGPGAGFSFGLSWSEPNVLMERQVGQPADFEYKILKLDNKDTLQENLNREAEEGFRFMGTARELVVMQRAVER